MKRTPTVLLAVILVLGIGTPAGAWDIEWADQYGTSGYDLAGGVAVDDANVYIAGTTSGALAPTSHGGVDAYLRKYDAAGTVVWARQFGTTGHDFLSGVAADGEHVYVAGDTTGVLPGATSSGGWDFFVRKLDASGTEIWTTQLGTSGDDMGQLESIELHGSALYVTGVTSGVFPGASAGRGWDRFVAKLDARDGDVQWIRQLGVWNPFETIGGISVSGAGVFVAGWTWWPDRSRAYLLRFDHDGALVWEREMTGVRGCSVSFWDVATWGDRVYVAGQWNEDYAHAPGSCPNQGRSPIVGVVQAYGVDGAEQWRRIVKAGSPDGTDQFTGAKRVHASADGVFVAANATGNFPGHRGPTPRLDRSDCKGLLPGNAFADKLDGYVRHFRPNGDVVWTHQFGSDVFDLVTALATSGDAVVAVGESSCRIDDEHTYEGSRDVFVVSFALGASTPAGAVQQIVGMLEALRDRGRLEHGSFGSLVADLEAAVASYERGDTSGAERALLRFGDRVRGMERGGMLEPDEAAPLIEAAERLARGA